MQLERTTSSYHIPYFGRVDSYPTMRLADLERSSISIEESEEMLTQQIHDFYHSKA